VDGGGRGSTVQGRRSIAIASLALTIVAATGAVALPAIISPWAIAVPGFALAIVGLSLLDLPRSTVAVLAVALATYGAYSTYTSYGERNFDGDEQLAYVRHVALRGALPSRDACFVCHHPPAYYLVAAGAHRLFDAVPIVTPTKGVQLLSLALAGAFAVFGALTLRRLEPPPGDLALGTALIACWPYTILNSARLHNDVLLASSLAGSLYFLVCWYQRGGGWSLWASVLLSLLAVVTKANGYVMVLTILATVAVRTSVLLADRGQRRIVFGAVLALVIGAGTFALVHGRGELGARPMLGTAADIGRHEWVENEPRSYLTFDVRDYLTEPYVFARRDEGGRQRYWNHLFKSSLFSTHNLEPDGETGHRFNRGLAWVMSPLLLVLLAIPLARLLLVPWRGWVQRYFPLVALSALLLLAHIAFKARVPAAHHNDFRFVHPVLVPFACAFALGADALKDRSIRLANLARATGWSFAALAVLYFLPLGPLAGSE
jgi:hypothetical protein